MYCFTDGCGNISEDLCELISEKYELEYCSAFQVRLGGIKGVFMRKIDLPPSTVEVRKKS